jgi:hypothetical protein
LPDRYFPGGVLKPKIENDLRRDAIDSAVEQPPFNGEGKYGQCEVRRALEKGMRDETVVAPFPFCKKRQFLMGGQRDQADP